MTTLLSSELMLQLPTTSPHDRLLRGSRVWSGTRPFNLREFGLSRRALDAAHDDTGGTRKVISHEIRQATIRAVRDGASVVRGLSALTTKEHCIRIAGTIGELLPQDTAGTVGYDVQSSGYRLENLRTDRTLRGAATATALPLHTDSAPHFRGGTPDVVALFALRAAPDGGETLIASAYAVHNELRRRSRELLHRAYFPFPFDRRDERDPVLQAPIFTYHGDQALQIRYSDFYIREGIARQGPGLPLADRTLDALEEITTDPSFAIKLRLSDGDLLLLNNRWVLHGRTSFLDTSVAARHLIRIWIRL